jgi:hypothetical protein
MTCLHSDHYPLTGEDTALCLMNLKSSPTTTILTLNPVNRNITATHHHDSIGLSLNGTMKCIALTGFEDQAFPVYLDLDRLLSKTQETLRTPSLDVLMALHDKTIDDVKNLNPSVDWNLTNVHRAVVLPPSLYASVLDQPWDSNEDLLLRMIKLIYTFKDNNDDEIVDADDDDDNDQWAFALDFTDLLISLYAFTRTEFTDHITTSHSSATDKQAVDWSKLKHLMIKQPNQGPTINISDDSNSVVSTLDKVITDRLTEARNKQFATDPTNADRDNGDNDQTTKKVDDATKAWLKIDPTFRQGVLFASCADEDTIPSLPNQRLAQVIHTKNGGTTAKLFTCWHPQLDLLVQQGMALNITKCMFTSSPSPSSINTFSVFFVPPSRAGFHLMSNDELNSIELSSSNYNLSTSDIAKLVHCKPYVPSRPDLFISQVQNFGAILNDCFSKQSQIPNLTTTPLIKHYNQNVHHYYQIFSEHEHFGVWLLNHLHFKVQSMLHQCFRADDIQDVEFDKYSMYGEIDAIDTLSFKADAPSWYLDLLAKANRPNKSGSYPHNDSDQGKRGSQDSRDDTPKCTKVFNNQRDHKVRLLPNEKYSVLVHYKNLEACESFAVKLHDDFVCNNWHICGHCFSNCKRNASHTVLPSEVERDYRNYVCKLRAHNEKFKNARRGGGNQRQGRNNCERTGEHTAD